MDTFSFLWGVVIGWITLTVIGSLVLAWLEGYEDRQDD